MRAELTLLKQSLKILNFWIDLNNIKDYIDIIKKVVLFDKDLLDE
jgi:hypothetical protein